MSTMTVTGTSGEFRVGAVLGRSLDLMRRHFVKFTLIAGVTLLPAFFSQHHLSSTARLFTIIQHLGSVHTQTVGVQRQSAIGWMDLLSDVLIAISAPAIVFGTVQSMRGRDFNIGESLGRSLQRFLPVIGVLIIFYIAFIVGFILLVVPGFIVATMFAVAVPVCVVEQAGPIQSLRRSAQLTKGNRWRLFGIWFLLAMLVGIPPIPIQFFLFSIAGTYVAALGGIAYGAISLAFQLVVFAVAYHDLRAAKEGIDIEQLATVFD